MKSNRTSSTQGLKAGYLIFTIAALAVVIVGIALVGIFKSRNDSYNLLVQQGTVFTEALAQACQNTIVSETYYDRLASDHYGDLFDDLVKGDAQRLTVDDLTRFARLHDLFGVYVYDSAGKLLLSDVAEGPVLRPPEVVEAAVRKLIGDFSNRSTTVFLQDTIANIQIHYFVQVTNQLDRVIVMAIDASLYEEARSRTGIGVLAQSMAEEPGIEYIVYQAKDGIVFSSRRNGSFMAIESDSFLVGALDSDTIMTRRTPFQGKEVLELVRPLATRRYPFGLLRVGVSLGGYFAVSRGFDRLMLVLALALIGLVVIGVLYVTTRRERAGLERDILHMRSIGQQIFAEISTGVALVDAHDRFQTVNGAFERMFGSAQLRGKTVSDLPPKQAAALTAILHSDSGASEREITFTVGNETRTLLVGRSVLTVDDPDRSGVLIVVTDITQLKEFEQAASRKERLSEMGHLAAAVAHEIRNPLNAISIAAQRLESEITPVDHQESFLSFTQQIRSETRRLNDIITRFLSLARGEASQKSPTDLTEVFGEFERLVAPEAARIGIALTIACEPGLRLPVDPARLKELLLNLFNNAKEALAGKPGKVAVQAQRLRADIVLRMSDSGPGIPADMRSKVFAPYFTTKEGGTGIGLAAVHQVVDDFGGTIAIEDSSLGGAAIVITIPAK
jgi:PAS domain S-box-containing protein